MLSTKSLVGQLFCTKTRASCSVEPAHSRLSQHAASIKGHTKNSIVLATTQPQPHCTVDNTTFFLDIGFSENVLQQLLLQHPEVAHVDTARLRALQSFFDDIGGGWIHLNRIISKAPELCTTQQQLQPVVDWLKRRGFQATGPYSYVTFLQTHPTFLLSDVSCLDTTLSILQSNGVSDAHLKKLLLTIPWAFGTDARDTHLLPLLDTLVKLGFSGAESATLMSTVPALLDRGPQQVHRILDLFAELGVQCSSFRSILLQQPRLLLRTPQMLRQRVVQLQQLSGGDAADIVEMLLLPGAAGSLCGSWRLQGATTQQLQPVLDHLLSVGVNRCRAVAVCLEHPELLQYSPAHLQHTTTALFDLGLTGQQVEAVISRTPLLLTCDSRTQLSPVIDWLTQQGFNKPAIASLLSKNPQILFFPTASLQRKVDYLHQLGVHQTKIAPLLQQFPQFLQPGFAVQSDVRTLQNILGFDRRDILHVVDRFPEILFCDYHLQHNCDSLLAAGLSRGQLLSMVRQEPRILGLDLHNPLNKEKLCLYTQQLGYGLHDIVAHPWLLLASLNHIQAAVADCQKQRSGAPFPQELLLQLMMARQQATQQHDTI